ncbi:MAG: D-tyrosyl-tRNA(Tyr) deacylase [Butyrivibrio sp.]|nr:D-tyrosyl-tRNA(Tyr) deacylase [Butyrivibrio sp.]
MRIVLQRVSEAAVTVDGKITGQIKKGLLILLGIEAKDTDEMLPAYVNKIIKMRIFEDENGKTNLSVTDVCGSLLVVSQFTLCADISHGNRPGFTNAKAPAEAERMYEKFIGLCKEYPLTVERGEFGADMKVSLINDGPFTIIM